MTPIQWLFLLAASALLLWVSRRALTDPGCHGFYRFFAFEAVATLIALNGPYWFIDRFSHAQLLSWTLLFVSLYLLFDGLRLLRRHGRTDPARDDPALLGFERTRDLVTGGIYAHIRHPLYASVILLAWGVCLKAPSTASGLLATLASVFMFCTARVEERECRTYFADAWTGYARRTRMFVRWLL